MNKWLKLDKYRTVVIKIIRMIEQGKQINQFNLDGVLFFQYEYKDEFLLTNNINLMEGQFGYYHQIIIKGKRILILIIPDTNKIRLSEDLDVLLNKIANLISNQPKESG